MYHLPGRLNVDFGAATEVQFQKIDELFDRGWRMETVVTTTTVRARMVLAVPDLLAVIEIDPESAAGAARMTWKVDDRHGVSSFESSDWLTAFVELADRLAKIAPALSLPSIPEEA